MWWQLRGAGRGSPSKCCASSFYLRPGRARAVELRLAPAPVPGSAQGYQARFKVPGPCHPSPCTPRLRGPCPPPPPWGSPPQKPGVKTLEAGPRWLPPCSVAPFSSADLRSPPQPRSLGRGPDQSALEPFLGLSSVPTLSQAGPPPAPGEAPALPPSPPTSVQPGQVDRGMDYLSQAFRSRWPVQQHRLDAVRSHRGPGAPRGEVADAQNKTCPALTSVPSLWLGPLRGEHLPEAEATEQAATLLCWPSGATAGPLECQPWAQPPRTPWAWAGCDQQPPGA